MRKLLSATVLSVFLIAPPAAADGLPLAVEASEEGILGAGGGVRFVTATARGKTAVIAQVPEGGRVAGAELLDGRFSVPLVSYDGAAGGLSGDEQTLVLVRPRKGFPRRRSTFAVLDTKLRWERFRARLGLRRVVSLKGDFSFDALSPDGRSLFLINYISRRNPRKYRVRVYDLKRGVLEPKPIVDPRESPDEMNGYPMSRAMSPDGRWAYTLYDGNEHPFIHALDTRARKAVCIDLDDVHAEPYGLRIAVERAGGTIAVSFEEKTVALVDTDDFEVREPPKAGQLGVARPRRGQLPWGPAAITLAMIASAAALVRLRA